MQIAIYGAGLYGRLFKAALEINKDKAVKPDFFIDQFSMAESIEGLPVKRIEAVENKSETCVYISVALNEEKNEMGESFGTKIRQQLVSSGFKEVYDFSDALLQIPDVLSHFPEQRLLWMHDDVSRMVNEAEIKKLEGVLSDETSRDLLKRIVAFRKSFDAKDYIRPDGQEEYFPEDVPVLDALDSLRFVDAGAYIGDTVASASTVFRQTGKPIDYIASFEPDLENIERLSDEIERQKELSPEAKYFVYTSGVWSENSILTFSNEGNSSSSITTESTQSDISIAVNSLDSVLFGAAPNYIKMDIEGAEENAILGAKKMIQTYRPALAICIYHKPEDLWELPLLVHSIEPSYDMSIRVHGHMGLSTVLYCLPKTIK
ncbi:FkbM family methyltransferase [Hydrogenovibrio kuenenii]|uniref:FkbM family methyltransferase n=1 Tax=Hydrogenovibrio kuenenii TaxID=63658 RepID=UPI00046721DF|nr:FkbM family methyltransferase [Hydrogenovibrio kuenenii]